MDTTCVLTCIKLLGMVDYQYQPDMNDPIAKLRVAMDNMDGKIFHTCAVHFISILSSQSRLYAPILFRKRKEST